MRIISTWLVAGGLVILTGPLCFTAYAQDYVDVEAERAAAAARAASAAPADPYGSPQAPAYPATSYGLADAPAVVSPVAGQPTPAPQQPRVQGQNMGNMFLQLQQLQQEVMRLNGVVEEQAHELRTLKEQSLQRYMDLDKRLAGSAAAGSTGSASVRLADTTGQAPIAAAPVAGSSVPAAEQPGEGEAYRAAYALVRSQHFDDAVSAYKRFLQDYPDGRYAPNAHYWLGELYLVVKPQDLESARQSFMLLLNRYPDNSKVPDAMYKLGKVYFLKGNRQKAREYLDRVVNEYGTSNASAVKLARDFIAENY